MFRPDKTFIHCSFAVNFSIISDMTFMFLVKNFNIPPCTILISSTFISLEMKIKKEKINLCFIHNELNFFFASPLFHAHKYH